MNALPSESIGTACRTLANFCAGCAPTRREGESASHQLGKARLDLLVAPAQRVVFGIRDGRRVLLVVALVVRADLGREPLELGLGLRLGEFSVAIWLVSGLVFVIARQETFPF